MYHLCSQIHSFSKLIDKCTEHTKHHNYLFISYTIIDIEKMYYKILKCLRNSWSMLNNVQREHIIYLIYGAILHKVMKLQVMIYQFHKKSTDIFDLLETIILSFQSILPKLQLGL